MRRIPLRTTLALVVAIGTTPLPARDDILIADFEGETYGEWKATGEAFGPGPARGTLPNQMEVSGFLGEGLVNSYFKGDDTTGTLASPSFRIQRKYINFLIGGGMHPKEACIDLIVDGKVVRTATGPNDKPGGSERLDWYSWDVAALEGKVAAIEIVDRRKGGWGHINIDQITQSDRRMGTVETVREIAIEDDYVFFRFPAKEGGRTRISLAVGGEIVRSAVGQDRDRPYWLSWDVARLEGKRGVLTVAETPAEDGSCPLAESVGQGDRPRGAAIVVDRIYRETYRPQFHFSPRTNWTNDPNGLVCYAGEYHLFFQHNPTGINWGNMTWGHAVSPDLVHWTELEDAIHPDGMGTIFSGSAVVDWENTAGFQTGDEKVLVAFYTSAGGTSEASRGQPFTQSIAYSNDRGRTWTKYAKNPVLGHIAGSNRDPKVIRYEPAKTWIMALFLDGKAYALFGSPDLKEWKKLCDVPMPGTGECPDLFPLAVDGDANRMKWVFWGGNGNYRLGSFDGKTFAPETDVLRSHWGANDYAAQTYSDIPPSDGRRIQIAWMSGGRYPGMPFNQQMSFPRVLTLRMTREGIRLHFRPVREIERIRGTKRAWTGVDLAPGADPLADLEGELWDIDATIAPGDATEVVLSIRGTPIAYDAKAGKLLALGREASLPAEGGRIDLRILVDRTSIEIFADGGRILMNSCFLPDPSDRSLGIRAAGGTARIEKLEIWPLRSAWPEEADPE
ncbi:MAG: GH32 C-terminal domain-containing protein [Planctomycetes bacterium]|nr:GH32 C-terminal domain-containing protein [Planctomycetota bacterium]